MSRERIEAVLDNTFGDVLQVLEDTSVQGIVPDINFTCDGNIVSWTLGAEWEGNTPHLTELQIWRSVGGGNYIKVGNTTVVEVQSSTSAQIYHYNLTSPLSFQAGDVLGFFQGSRMTSQLGLLYEEVSTPLPIHYTMQNNATSEFSMDGSLTLGSNYHMLINVETG